MRERAEQTEAVARTWGWSGEAGQDTPRLCAKTTSDETSGGWLLWEAAGMGALESGAEGL